MSNTNPQRNGLNKVEEEASTQGSDALSTELSAELFPTPPLTVNGLLLKSGAELSQTPGNVAVCLSGGGSRALSAGMGQLRGLRMLMDGDETLLQQIKVLSTVSGGSWVGMAYSYLDNQHVSDDDFLGPYQAPNQLTSQSIGILNEGNIGNTVLESNSFGLSSFVWQATKKIVSGVTPSMVWQEIIGDHVLQPYGLYSPDSSGLPTTTFSYNETTATKISSESGLNNVTIHTLADADDPSRYRRPFPVCNMAMRVTYKGNEFYAPVQSSPFFTGIVGYPENGQATDKSGQGVGGGGVESFGFNSIYKGRDESAETENVLITQERQWSITDFVGVSSAAIAAAISAALDWLPLAASKEDKEKFRNFIGGKELSDQEFEEVCKVINLIRERDLELSIYDYYLIPKYFYWPVVSPVVLNKPKEDRFVDAGLLENTGVASALAYSDVDSIISFINTDTPMKWVRYGVSIGGVRVYGTNIQVADQIPPLFGFKPYDKDKGYVQYTVEEKSTEMKSACQIFPPTYFPELLKGLWEASGNADELDPSNRYPATFRQQLFTVDNDWFGVRGGRKIDVIWCHLNFVQSWYDLLDDDVKSQVPKNFPHYDTVTELGLTPTKVNLLANLTAWTIAQSQNVVEFIDIFKDRVIENASPVPVYQYRLPANTEFDRYFYSLDRRAPEGWEAVGWIRDDNPVFSAYAEEVNGTIPVFMYCNSLQPTSSSFYMLSTDSNLNSSNGWYFIGLAFYAYRSGTAHAANVSSYYNSSAGTWSFCYAPAPELPLSYVWQSSYNAGFSALYTAKIDGYAEGEPVYCFKRRIDELGHQAFYYSLDHSGLGGWEYLNIAFYAYSSAVEGTNPIYYVYKKLSDGTPVYALSDTDQSLSGWETQGVAFYAFPAQAPIAGASTIGSAELLLNDEYGSVIPYYIFNQQPTDYSPNGEVFSVLTEV